MCVYLSNINTYVIYMRRMRTLRLTLWGDFAKVEGAYFQENLFIENILLTSRVHIRDYQGILIIKIDVLITHYICLIDVVVRACFTNIFLSL